MAQAPLLTLIFHGSFGAYRKYGYGWRPTSPPYIPWTADHLLGLLVNTNHSSPKPNLCISVALLSLRLLRLDSAFRDAICRNIRFPYLRNHADDRGILYSHPVGEMIDHVLFAIAA
jgi:hypothetical protein